MANVVERARAAGSAGAQKTMEIIDYQIPPEKRSELAEWAQQWASTYPKLSTFLFAQLGLASIPILVFLIFATSIFLASMTTCVLLGALLALTFTGICIGGALLILIPTLLITSITAIFVWFWGYIGYLIIQKYNAGQVPVPSARAIRNKANEMSDGRLELLAASREERLHAIEAARSVAAQRGNISANSGDGDWNKRWSDAARTNSHSTDASLRSSTTAQLNKSTHETNQTESSGLTMNQYAAQVTGGEEHTS